MFYGKLIRSYRSETIRETSTGDFTLYFVVLDDVKWLLLGVVAQRSV